MTDLLFLRSGPVVNRVAGVPERIQEVVSQAAHTHYGNMECKEALSSCLCLPTPSWRLNLTCPSYRHHDAARRRTGTV